jgi:hypothetical protein
MTIKHNGYYSKAEERQVNNRNARVDALAQSNIRNDAVLADAASTNARANDRTSLQQLILQRLRNQSRIEEQSLRNKGAMDTTSLISNTNKEMQKDLFGQQDKTAATARAGAVEDRDTKYNRDLGSAIASLMGQTGQESYVPDDIAGREGQMNSLAATVGKMGLDASKNKSALAAEETAYKRGQDQDKFLLDFLGKLGEESSLLGGSVPVEGKPVEAKPVIGADGKPVVDTRSDLMQMLRRRMKGSTVAALDDGPEEVETPYTPPNAEMRATANEAKRSLAGGVREIAPVPSQRIKALTVKAPVARPYSSSTSRNSNLVDMRGVGSLAKAIFKPAYPLADAVGRLENKAIKRVKKDFVNQRGY